jgi:hypothetical protein
MKHKNCIPTHVKINIFQDGAVILDLNKNTYYNLNESAAIFLKHLTDECDFEVAIKNIYELYEVDDPMLREDMKYLLYSLIKIGIIEDIFNL